MKNQKLGRITFRRYSRHSMAMTIDAASSSHIIQMYTLLKGDRFAFVCLYAIAAARTAKMPARPNTNEAIVIAL
jgi:hypothetical protein